MVAQTTNTTPTDQKMLQRYCARKSSIIITVASKTNIDMPQNGTPPVSSARLLPPMLNGSHALGRCSIAATQADKRR